MDTFIVRLWTPADARADADVSGFRGTVHHVASGRTTTFRNGEQMLELLRDLRLLSGDELGRAETSSSAHRLVPNGDEPTTGTTNGG